MKLLIFSVVAIFLIPLCLFAVMHTIVSLFGLLHFLFLDIWKKETWKVGWKTILLARFSGVSPEERRIRKSSDSYLESDLLYGRNTYIDQVGRSKSWTAERAKKWDAHGFKYEPAKWPMNIRKIIRSSMARLTIQETCIIEACGSEHTCDIFGTTHSITGEQFTQQLEHPIEIIPTFWAFTGRVWQIVNAHELNKKHPEAEARAEITYHVNSLKRDGKI